MVGGPFEHDFLFGVQDVNTNFHGLFDDLFFWTILKHLNYAASACRAGLSLCRERKRVPAPQPGRRSSCAQPTAPRLPPRMALTRAPRTGTRSHGKPLEGHGIIFLTTVPKNTSVSRVRRKCLKASKTPLDKHFSEFKRSYRAQCPKNSVKHHIEVKCVRLEPLEAHTLPQLP